MFLYVGELVRYLLAAPKCDLERAHSLQLMVGVGLRPNLWKICRTRFGVTKIMESYGSTEANCSLSESRRVLFANYLHEYYNAFSFCSQSH